jgi:hypothetical protein
MGSTRTHNNTTTCLWRPMTQQRHRRKGELINDKDDTIAPLGTKSIYLFLQIDNKIVNHQMY